MKVELRKYETSDLEILGQYTLPEEQMSFTMLPSNWPNIDEEKRKTKLPVTIWYEGEPVGFFVLDSTDDKLAYTENQDALLLRSLSINPAYQRKGIGKTAMKDLLINFSTAYYPNCSEIVFGVNEDNAAAYQLYLKCGFEDTGNKYFGGNNGPQIIMMKKIT